MMLMSHACTQMHLHTYILMNTCWYARAHACPYIHAHIHHLEPYGKFLPLLITQPQILSYNNRKIPRQMLTLWIARSKPSPIPHYILYHFCRYYSNHFILNYCGNLPISIGMLSHYRDQSKL